MSQRKLMTWELELIEAIADRASSLAASQDIIYPRRDAQMDIMSAHLDCGLRLKELAAADPFNFAHDVFGINRHLNHETLKLEHCFVPRFVAR